MDPHTEMILEEYDQQLPLFRRLERIVQITLQDILDSNGLMVTAVNTRIKTRESLAGKLELKGYKYHSISDITDILGSRIITLYTDDVDRIAAMAEQVFDIDWENSVDKRRLHNTDSFGYNSVHYICRLPKTLVDEPNWPQLNETRFELQLRTTLQHAWASLDHDIGYKTGVEIPHVYTRQINRLAGMLEMVDDEFSRIRTEITDYRRRVQQLVQNGKLDDVQLDGDTFRSYLEVGPFDILNRRIAAINQAEIQEVPLTGYLRVFIALGCKTLGDVDRLRQQYTEDAYGLARHQLGSTDLDIVSSSVGIQNVCIVRILATGGGKIGLTRLFNALNGESPQNELLAEMTYNQAMNLPLMQKNNEAH
jgi:ppGpp synthetase/RelA/SpoT-type nucleotidyltranferase